MDDLSIKDMNDMLCTGSKLVSDKPCWVYSVIFNGDNHTYSEFALRDGHNSSAPAVEQMQVGQYAVVPLIYKHPKRFKDGLYVHFVGDGYTVSVQYLPDY